MTRPACARHLRVLLGRAGLLVVLAAWVGSCGQAQDPSQPAHAKNDPIAADYARYLQAVSGMEAKPYESREMVALRRRWITHFVDVMRATHGTERHRAASTALLLLLNLGRFTSDWGTHAPEAYSVAMEALADPPAGSGAAESCVWIADIARESGAHARAEELLSSYAVAGQDSNVKSAAMLSLAQVQHERGDLDTAGRTLDTLLGHAPDSPESVPGRGLLSEIRHLKTGDVPPLHEIVNLVGESGRPADAPARWTWLEFFSLACGSCNLDYGLVGELNTWLESRGVTVYSIELESPDSVREGRPKRARGMLIPSDHSVVSQFNVNYVPRNFVLDPTGKIVRKDVPAAEARAVWESLLSAGKTASEAR